MPLRATLPVLASLLVLGACGSTTSADLDAGSPDGGTIDAAAAMAEDAGALEDAGAPDAGGPADATALDDAGAAVDAGSAGDAGPSVDGGAVDPVQLQALFEEVICEARVRCELNQDQATCLQSFAERTGTSFGTLVALVDSVAAGKVDLDAAQIPGCLAAIRALECSDSATGYDVTGLPACRAAFYAGRVAAGEACIHSAACVSGTYCRQGNAGTCSGQCTAEPAACTGPLGDPTDDLCGFARACAKSAGTYQCTDFMGPGSSGQTCGSRGLCNAGLECASGVCQPLPSVGGACSILMGCHDPEAEVCVFQGSLGTFCMADAAAGDACDWAIQCGGFESPLACDPDAHLCVERPSAGEACILAAPGNAIGFCDELTAYCDTAVSPPTCAGYKASGASCSSNDECGPWWSNRKCSGVCGTQPAAQRCGP